MEKYKTPSVNDGKGFYDNDGLCDSLIVDCNELGKALAGGQYISFCGRLYQMVQKIQSLKTGIKADRDAQDRKIEELKNVNNSLVEQITGLPVEKTSEKDGAE